MKEREGAVAGPRLEKTLKHVHRPAGRETRIPKGARIPQFLVIHSVKGFGIVNKAEIDVFLELSCFLVDPANVGI